MDVEKELQKVKAEQILLNSRIEVTAKEFEKHVIALSYARIARDLCKDSIPSEGLTVFVDAFRIVKECVEGSNQEKG